MAKKRTSDPWMPAPEYGASLKGLGLNLLVADIEIAVQFATSVLEAEVVYADPDFAVLRGHGSEWMLHADHTYENHPLSGFTAEGQGRGAGAEFRIHGLDPDLTEQRARDGGYTVLAGALDKPHGLRESYLLDPDGYCWVPDIPLRQG